MRAVWHLAVKDLILLWRDKGALFWALGFPVMFALFFGSFFSSILDTKPKPMRVAFIDEDQSEFSIEMLERVEAQGNILVQHLSESEAKSALRRGGLAAIAIIPRGFGESSRLLNPNQRPIYLNMDPSRKLEAGFLQGMLLRTSFAMQAEAMRGGRSSESGGGRDGRMKEGGHSLGGPQAEILPADMEKKRPRTAFEISFPSAIIWGILSCVSTFAVSIAVERQQGTLLRLRFAPLTRWQILAGKGLGCFLACQIVAALMLTLGFIVFGVRFDNLAGLLVTIICAGLCFVGIMMLTSVLGTTEQSVSGAGWGMFIPMTMFGGAMVPLMFMPEWMKTVGNASPIKWANVAMEGAIWRGFSLGELLPACGIMLGIGVLFFAAGLWRFARIIHD